MSGKTSSTSRLTSTASDQIRTTNNQMGVASTASDMASYVMTSSLIKESKTAIFFLKMYLRKSLIVIITFSCTFILKVS